MKSIDFKSLVIGLLLSACVFLALGAAGTLQSDAERYRIACPDSTSVCFVIDTHTGQVWRRHSGSSGSNYGSPASWKK